MEYLYPTYYHDFQCIAGSCPKTCCAGWQIEIDAAHLEAYEKMHIDSVDYKEACFLQKDHKRCQNLAEDGLCQLITTYGEDILCDTCRLFPRHTELFCQVRELSLSISCPEVARMILTRVEPVRYEGRMEAEVDEEDYTPEEVVVYSQLRLIRRHLLAILQDRSVPLETRFGHLLTMVGVYQDEVDDLLMEERPLDALPMEEICQVAGGELDTSKGMMETLLGVTEGWEYTEPELSEWFVQTGEILASMSEQAFGNQRKAFYQALADAGIAREVVFEQLMVYFLFAYFCGSVYDEYYYGQAQLAVAACYHVELLLFAKYQKQEALSMEDVIRYTYIYARELEHSTPNILATEQYMEEHPMLKQG